MKLNIPFIGVLVGVVALASVAGIYAISYDSGFTLLDKDPNFTGATMMTGNVKVLHLDENGDIKGIRHGTNHIVLNGMRIIMGQVFTGINQTYGDSATCSVPCPGLGNNGNVTGRVGWMQIGTSGENAYGSRPLYNNTDVITNIGGGSLSSPGTFVCGRVAATIANTTAQDAHGSPSSAANPANDGIAGVGRASLVAAQMNVTAVANFEGNLGCDVASIDEAGIYTGDDEEGDLMFARNTFGSVTLGDMDTLQLQWEFTFKDDIS